MNIRKVVGNWASVLEPVADVLITPTQTAAERVCEEHTSEVERARNALQRSGLDPRDYPELVHDIATEIWKAEQFLLKGLLSVAREAFGRKPPR